MPKPYLIQRPSGLYARFLVPVDLRAAIGSRFLVRRLPPSSSDLARLAAARMAVALSQAFARMRTGAMADWKKELRDTLAGDISTWSGNIELPNGAKMTGLQVNGREDAQALLDTIKGMGGASFVANLPPAAASTETLARRIDFYLQDLRNARLSAGNLLDAENTLTIFRELTGDAVPMVGVSEHHVRRFLSEIQHWPKNARKGPLFAGLQAGAIIQKAKRLREAAAKDAPALSPPEALTPGKKKPDPLALLSARTLGKHRDRLASFLNAQVEAGLLDKSPLAGIKRHKAVAPDEGGRRAFTIHEIEKIFDPATFLPWVEGRPDRYWGTLIGLTTGARVNEVAQLYRDDIEQIAGVWGVKFQRGRPDQKIKPDTPARFVPLHPGLIAAGLLFYRDDVEAAGHARLFPHLPWHSKAGYGDALGDQFRAYLDRIGLIEPGLGFHSFRHTASTRMLYAGIVPAIGSAITGHGLALPGSMAIYVDPPTIPQRLDAVKVLPLPKWLPVYKKGAAATALQVAHAKAKRREVNRAARKRQEAAQAKAAKSRPQCKSSRTLRDTGTDSTQTGTQLPSLWEGIV